MMASERVISVFMICLLTFGDAHAMIKKFIPHYLDDVVEKTDSSNFSLNNATQVGKLFIAPAIVSVSSYVFDEFANKTFKHRLKEDVIAEDNVTPKSRTYMLIKAIILSLPCYFCGQSQLIPGIFFDEYLRHETDRGGISNERLLAQSFVVLSISGGITSTIFNEVIPFSVSRGRALYGYPAAKLGLTDNKRFSQESWGLRAYGLGIWSSDHVFEPFGYSIYLQQQKNEGTVKKIAKFMMIFLLVSYVKYVFLYPDHFSRTKRCIGIKRSDGIVEMYENLPLQTWFGFEVISKYVIMQLVSTDAVSDAVHGLFFRDLVDQEACRLFFPFLSSVFSLVLLKACELNIACPKQENHIMPVHMNSFKEMRTGIYRAYKKFGLL